jgi:hypothetical protein
MAIESRLSGPEPRHSIDYAVASRLFSVACDGNSWGRPEGKNHLEGVDVVGTILLKGIFKKWDVEA